MCPMITFFLIFIFITFLTISYGIWLSFIVESKKLKIL